MQEIKRNKVGFRRPVNKNQLYELLLFLDQAPPIITMPRIQPPNQAPAIAGSADWLLLRNQIAGALLDAASEAMCLEKKGFRVTKASELLIAAHKIACGTKNAGRHLISTLEIEWSDAWDNFLYNNNAAANLLGR